MTGRQFLHGLQLEYQPAVNQQVHEIRLAEVAKRHFDQRLRPNAGPTSSDFVPIDVLVEESAQLVVNLENGSHHLVGDPAGLGSGHSSQFGVNVDGHVWRSPVLDRKMRDRNMKKQNSCRQIFLSPNFPVSVSFICFMMVCASGHCEDDPTKAIQ